MIRDPIAIYYARDVGFAAQISAELCAPPEASRAVVTLNYDGGREIGAYQTELSDEEFRRVLQLLRGSRYERFQSPPVSPETPLIVIGERRAGEEEPTLVRFPLTHLPDEVAQVANEIEQTCVARIRRHRHRVVVGTAAWQRKVLTPREPLLLRMTLENSGPLPIVLGNPLDPSLEDGTGLNLVVVREGETGGDSMVRLDPRHLRLPPDGPASGEVTLAPGESVSFEIEKKVYLPPGTYQGRLVYMNVIDRPGDPQFIEGQLFVDLGRFVIEPPSW